jgi:hypothetical protein
LITVPHPGFGEQAFTLQETDEKLTELAEQINTEANGEEGAEEGEKKGVFQADKKKSRRVA